MTESIGNGRSGAAAGTEGPVKLSQWDALLLESLRSRGWSSEELIARVREGNLPADDSEFEFDYRRLTELEAENPEAYRRAVVSGYRIKYNTIRGIRSWIQVALGREPELELEEGKEAVRARLTAAQAQRLEEVLSPGWRMDSGLKAGAATEEAVEVTIVPERPE
ncbi:hypothetical protein [Paenibacillus spiritus]|uniref:hypothetical protein n=1 Tax=Paenibacillus spiritus TaxID=2496557 RepID=UPI00168B9005|nr:hypothetical protein [Paenibacillus spiritus]